MGKIDLEFTPPVSFGEFVNNHKGAKYPGIYIWGFMNDGKFVPYYVGEILDSIYSRINGHFNKIKTKNTYTIFEEKFYFKDLAKHLNKLKFVPKPYKNLHSDPQFNGYFNSRLVYFNNLDFLEKKYVALVSKDMAKKLEKNLTSQEIDKIMTSKTTNIQNTIDKVFTKEKLFISYCIPKEINSLCNNLDKKSKSHIKFKKEIKHAETFVKFNLPNNVISDSGKLTVEIKSKFNIKLPLEFYK